MVDKELGGLVKKEVDDSGTNHLDSIHSGYGQSDLSELTLVDLVIRFNQIDRQSQLFKGQILLEARNRFPSNVEFGKWLSVNFTELDTSNTGKLINLAKFFSNGRSLEGIPLSAGYLLASPGNEDVASDVYEEIKDKSLSLKEIKGIIELHKHPTQSVDEDVIENVSFYSDELSDYEDEDEDDIDYEDDVVFTEPHFQPSKEQIFISLSTFTIEEKMVVLSLLNTSFLKVDANDDIVQVVVAKFKVHQALLSLGRVYSDREILATVNKLFIRTIISNDGFSEVRWIYEKQYGFGRADGVLRVTVHPSIIENAKEIVTYCKKFRYSWFGNAKLSETTRLYEMIVHYGNGDLFFTLSFDEFVNWFGFCLDDGNKKFGLEDVLAPVINEFNQVSPFTIELEVDWGASNVPIRILLKNDTHPSSDLTNQEIIAILRGWEDKFVKRDSVRVKKTGEVFTPTQLAQQTLSSLPSEAFTNPEKTFFDPACGNGQLLSEVLIKKLQNGIAYPVAISTIFGCDIMPDNIKTCRDRLLCGMEQYRYILEKNIICADYMKFNMDEHYANWD